MTAQRLWLAAIAATIVFMALTGWSQQTLALTAAQHADPTDIPRTTTVIENMVPAVPLRGGDVDEPRVDLNGNEVDDAVGDYRIDAEGQMYERHAPDTALLHLSAPEL